MIYYAEPVSKLITALNKLPGVGPKTAQRLAFYLLNAPLEEVRGLTGAILEARQKIHYCSVCQDLTDIDPCRICRDTQRSREQLCVVAEPRDVVALEKTREYRGLYHVLHGVLSPLAGIGPDQLKIKELFIRLKPGMVQEVILALNPNTEGEVTALYLARLMKPMGMKVTCLAYGLPVGGDLEYADEVTLSRALEGRRQLE